MWHWRSWEVPLEFVTSTMLAHRKSYGGYLLPHSSLSIVLIVELMQ